MGLFRGNDQRDRDLRPVQQEVTISSTTNGFDYQISIIHFLLMLKSASTFTFQKGKKKKKRWSLFCKSFENVHLLFHKYALQLETNCIVNTSFKNKSILCKPIIRDQCIIQALGYRYYREHMHLSEPTFIKLSHILQTYSFYCKNCNFVDVNYLINCYKIFYRNKVISGTFVYKFKHE